MAKLRINVPARDASLYLEEVVRQIREGYTSGHVDSDTNWDFDCDPGEGADDLQ